jgi:hypothetical protein
MLCEALPAGLIYHNIGSFFWGGGGAGCLAKFVFFMLIISKLCEYACKILAAGLMHSVSNFVVKLDA